MKKASDPVLEATGTCEVVSVIFSERKSETAQRIETEGESGTGVAYERRGLEKGASPDKS